ncbi:hypothetical protein ABW19_dt0203216 [Dactylella cylindrospora]|nr:hypothetical protein ABW19_dt0203216 [Dactylella cylindrospora]
MPPLEIPSRHEWNSHFNQHFHFGPKPEEPKDVEQLAQGLRPGRIFHYPPILRISPDLLTDICQYLPTVHDVISLRRSCKVFYKDLGGYNARLWAYFVTTKGQEDVDNYKILAGSPRLFFTIAKRILSGQLIGCQLCLATGTPRETMIRGGVFYKRVCRMCVDSKFYKVSEFHSSNKDIKLHPNVFVTISGDDSSHGGTGEAEIYVRAAEANRAIEEHNNPPTPTSTELKDAEVDILELDMAIESIVAMIGEVYDYKYQSLHIFQPTDDLRTNFSGNMSLLTECGDSNCQAYIWDAFNLAKEYLAMTRDREPFDPVKIEHSILSCLEGILAPTDYSDTLPWLPTGIGNYTKEIMEEWIVKNKYKGAPSPTAARNIRKCPYCSVAYYEKSKQHSAPQNEERSEMKGTLFLTIHIWSFHPENLEESWEYLPAPIPAARCLYIEK